MKIIGIFAQLAGGKDTVANHLVKRLNESRLYIEDGWSRLGFADAVKHVFMDAFGVTWEWIEEWKRKDEVPPGFDLTVRKGLQHIGDGFRKIQADVWIRKAMKEHVIISDGRYLNEAKMIKEQGGFNVLLWRKNFENNDPNPSEAQIRPYVDFCAKWRKPGPLPKVDPNLILMDCPEGMEYFDYFLTNNGTLQDLYEKVEKALLPEILKFFDGVTT
jgi:hypothetical protein